MEGGSLSLFYLVELPEPVVWYLSSILTWKVLHSLSSHSNASRMCSIHLLKLSYSFYMLHLFFKFFVLPGFQLIVSFDLTTKL